MDNNWRPDGTILWIWIWTWLGNRTRLRLRFVPPMSIEDRPLHWILVRSQTYYPEHILAYGGRKARCSLVLGSGSFGTD